MWNLIHRLWSTASLPESQLLFQIDTAVLYENHRDIGEALATGTVPREEAGPCFRTSTWHYCNYSYLGLHFLENWWKSHLTLGTACLCKVFLVTKIPPTEMGPDPQRIPVTDPCPARLSRSILAQPRHRWDLCGGRASSGWAWHIHWPGAKPFNSFWYRATYIWNVLQFCRPSSILKGTIALASQLRQEGMPITAKQSSAGIFHVLR